MKKTLYYKAIVREYDLMMSDGFIIAEIVDEKFVRLEGVFSEVKNNCKCTFWMERHNAKNFSKNSRENGKAMQLQTRKYYLLHLSKY